MKKFKPISPGSRHRVIIKSLKFNPFKPLITGLPKTGFRNNLGRITIRHRGGGHKINYRLLDINRINCNNSPIEVLRIEKDPNRSAFIALCKSQNSTITIPHSNTTPSNIKIEKENKQLSGVHHNAPATTAVRIKGHKYFYIIAPHNVSPGFIITPDIITLGTTLPLHKIQLGSLIHNVQYGLGGLARSAGTYCTIISHNSNTNKTVIKLPSKELLELPSTNKATIGIVSNILNNKTVLGKAGASRWIGRRPVVRGEVMNPIDHPHGGKTRGGRPIRNIWGNLAKWVPTSSSKSRALKK